MKSYGIFKTFPEKFTEMRYNVFPCRCIFIHRYHSRFIPEGVAEASQIFLRDAHVLPKLLRYAHTADVTVNKPIAVWSQYISGVNAINPLVAFYDIHGRKREVLFFYFVPDTTRGHWFDKLFLIPLSHVFPIPFILEITEVPVILSVSMEIKLDTSIQGYRIDLA
jgi:hypothetical protein